MNVDVQDVKPCKKVMKISLPVNVLKDAHQKVLKEFISHSKLPGFRQGRAPLKMIEKRFSDEIKQETLKGLLPKLCGEAMQNHQIKPVGDPTVDQIQYDLEKGLFFTATVDVFPSITIPKYKQIKIEKEIPMVKDEEIDRALDEIRDRYATFEPVARRELMMGDYAMVDLISVDLNGKKEERKNSMIFLKEDDPDGFSRQMVGMAVSENRKIALDANEHHSKMTISVHLHEIKEKKLPTLDDEFVKAFPDVKDVPSLRLKIQEDILSYKKKLSDSNVRTLALKQLVDDAEFDVPQSQVSAEVRNIYLDYEHRSRHGMVSMEELKNPALSAGILAEASRRVKAGYILYDISQKEKIEVSDDEIREEVKLIAEKAGKSEEDVRTELQKSGRWDIIRSQKMQDKAIDFIVQNAIIKEK